MLFFYLSSYSSIKWRRTPVFHIAKAGIQVDVLHAFMILASMKGLVFLRERISSFISWRLEVCTISAASPAMPLAACSFA